MQVLIVGSGGREHALAAAAAQSPLCKGVFVAPGNAGTDAIATNLPIQPDDVAGLVQAASEYRISLALIGPEAALVAGVADALRAKGVAVFGPGKEAAQIEGSKIFAKQFMDTYRIPTAKWELHDDPRTALQALAHWDTPPVIKADGLAAGKGVYIPTSDEEATTAIGELLVDRRFGEAGNRILFEERLEGEEVSYLVLTDGNDFVAFPPAQDHKRIFEGDQGPNTGGMGAYAPTTLVNEALRARIETEVIERFLAGMRAEGLVYRGVIYAGLMIVDGAPKVLEFNARFGDPECQPLLFGLQSDLIDLTFAAANGDLSGRSLDWYPGSVMAVVMAAAGYPDAPRKGDRIHLPKTVPADTAIFHAGTTRDHDDHLITSGGRVLAVTARGSTLATATRNAYDVVEQITFEGAQVRHDIGYRELARQA